MKELEMNNEFQPSNKRPLFILLSFLIPALIILIALVGLKVVPFGDNSLAMSF